eukprot:Hpha_TRINITY_DN15444_c0_g2::TRINITY_DN15444_c0_g2_i1::g.176063::m.176063
MQLDDDPPAPLKRRRVNIMLNEGARKRSSSETLCRPRARERRTMCTPLHCAAYRGNAPELRRLLTEAAMRGTLPVALREVDEDGGTLLHAAAYGGCGECVRLLFAHGVDPTIHDAQGTAPQELAESVEVAALFETPLHAAVREGHIADVERMLRDGAAVDARDAAGRTPLHVATLHCQREIATLLIGRGADLAARDNSGFVPFF